MLHILMRSPFETNMVLLMNMLESVDDILMLQNSVVLALKNNVFLNKILSYSVSMYALKQDLCARGILDNISPNVNVIGYNRFVDLTVKHKQQMSW
ncbi:hypothetical protein bbp_473 [Buchnera aphidicola str. Bp (Baizongia pistaciae)]|uniref:Protein TusB n=1 Tax=Buchnera aphidicola subsp. Baizongia pistaciae (strain Bp) TaxID=224915 RepID=TUSB_BUCBP|nr:sulfurtransferase complex subunit TusB [Buchnera aphidicola]Q89A64.1 RecName: Full=Protein TusB; AltName: Full=tRNA 2-thiouridine synthesizing protein B [Buchnera aphidicola str. Bp (Baizongia pistaciae)]AAO27179.1 hypothetical protein bbp_473 [Buchnera aphidicola str. Bp (Baizongia pistaciae)]